MDCCKVSENLVLQARDPGRPDISMLICKVCGRRHIRLRAESGGPAKITPPQTQFIVSANS